MERPIHDFRNGGLSGGWTEYDHGVYLRERARHANAKARCPSDPLPLCRFETVSLPGPQCVEHQKNLNGGILLHCPPHTHTLSLSLSLSPLASMGRKRHPVSWFPNPKPPREVV